MSEKIKDPVTEFNIDSLVAETYNNIAQWHNEEPTKASLKQLSLEIVEKISTATLKHIGLNGNLTVYKNEETERLKSEQGSI